MGLKPYALRKTVHVKLFDPRGRVALTWEKKLSARPPAGYVPLGWDVPPGADGKLWSFTVWPRNRSVERMYVRLEGPAWLATSPDAFFLPKGELPPRRILKRRTPQLPGKRRFLAIAAGKTLVMPRGKKKGPGRYERIASAAGTVELRLRPWWGPDDLQNRMLFRCGRLIVHRRTCIGTYVAMAKRTVQCGFVMGRGHWHHAAIVWGPADKGKGLTTTRLYINGVCVGQMSQRTSAFGDWTGKHILVGSAFPLDIDDLRISDLPRYIEDFDPGPLGKPDEHALVQLDFEGKLPPFAEVK